VKFFHNEKLALAWAYGVELVVHLLFAAGAFLLGGFIGEVALTSVFGQYGATIGSWLLAIFVFGAAWQSFVLGEYTREHVESYEMTARGNGSYIRAWTTSRWLAGGLEISCLLYRVFVVTRQGDIKQAIILVIFGVIALWYAFVCAKIIHASVNRPPEYDMMQAQASVGRGLAMDSLKYTDDMNPEEKARFVAGDITAIQDVAARRAYAAEQKERIKQSKDDARAAKAKAAATKAEIQAANAERGRSAVTRLFQPSTWHVGTPRSDSYAAGHDPKNVDFLGAQSQSGQSLSNGNRK
jgi:hypothetical protein